MPAHLPTDYRVAPALAARLVGLALAAAGALMFVATLLVAVAGLGAVVLLVVAVTGVVGAGVLAWWVGTRARVVRLDDLGYRVRFVRGVGTPAARWTDAVDAELYDVAGSTCLVVRLRDGRTTTVPLEVLAGDGSDFTEDVRARIP